MSASGYKVLIDDNFDYMDEDARVTYGVFVTADEAVTACRAIVDGFLAKAYRPGMSAAALYDHYQSFGDDPFVMAGSPDDPKVTFSAWTYARQRCDEIAGPERPSSPESG
jgi:hypothetical protein